MRRDGASAWVAVLVGAATLSGCAGGLGAPDVRKADAAPPVDRGAASAALLASYLEVLRQLLQGPPAEQAEILAVAQRDYQIAPTPSHELRLALVLAEPGHAGFDAAHAQRLLREILAAPETLLPAERSLALLTLQTVDRQLTLSAENQRLQADTERFDRERLTALNKRLQTEQDENARLRKELDEARAKLDAIANIERSLNKRKTRAEGSTP